MRSPTMRDPTFEAAGFTFTGGYLYYRGRFVARFKYARVPIGRVKFQKQLVRRFTPARYFAEYDAGVAPLEILRQDDPMWYNRIMDEWKMR